MSHAKLFREGVRDLPNSSYGSNLYLLSDESGDYYPYCPSENHRQSSIFLILRWCSSVFHKILNVYLSSPLLLVLLPTLLGVCIGICIASYLNYGSTNKNKAPLGSRWEKIKTLLSTIWFVLSSELKFDSELTGQDQIFEKNEGDSSSAENNSICEINDDDDDDERDEKTRNYVKSEVHSHRESGVPFDAIPKHIAVIMDGNRRYGRSKYNNVARGHWDGSKTLVDFCKWCLAEGVQILTVYAFSTENWNRSKSEISALMNIFVKYCDELRIEAVKKGIRIQVLSTETDQIPKDVANGMKKMVEDTKNGDRLKLNICLSYGSRGEIVNACRGVIQDVQNGQITLNDVDEKIIQQKLLTGTSTDPDLIIRTSGEYRLSNFLLWQAAYSEMFFLDKQWPELNKFDLLQVIRQYANDRKRRFGK